MKRSWDFDYRKHCPKCGSFNIEELSDGTIICKNKGCLAVSRIEKEGGNENE